MPEYYTNKSEQTSYKEIILNHYKKCLELSTNEFRGGYYQESQKENSTERIYVPDGRILFIQAVDTLALSLSPYFDETINKEYEEYNNNSEKLHNEYAREDGFIHEDNKIKHNIKKIELTKRLFKNISTLLYRIGYLKTATFGEDDIKEDIIDLDKKEGIEEE